MIHSFRLHRSKPGIFLVGSDMMAPPLGTSLLHIFLHSSLMSKPSILDLKNGLLDFNLEVVGYPQDRIHQPPVPEPDPDSRTRSYNLEVVGYPEKQDNQRE